MNPEKEELAINARVANVRLRCVERADLAKLFEFHLDPEANRMAFTHPRSAEDFDAHWENILADSSVRGQTDSFLPFCL